MSGVRASVYYGGVMERMSGPGDIVLGGENLLNGTLATNGAGIWTGALMANGLIYRTTVGAGYTDTTDTASNIIAALAGNAASADALRGSTFRMRFINSIAQTHTFAAGTGVLAGTGTLSAAASTWRDYLVTILSTQHTALFQMVGNNTYKTLFFGNTAGAAGVAPTTTTSLPMVGSNGTVGTANIEVGAYVTGTNVAAATRVVGLIEGLGGIIGVTLDTALSGDVNGAVTFGPYVMIDTLGSGTL